MLSLVCIFFLGRVHCFFFSWEGTCDQHRANQHCPDRGSGVMQPHRTVRGENASYKINQCSAEH
ncbi:unnamed protein product [Staurois parvus]|uniref:Secreted protein n=1 Tax=Staurois parvus TaxID=386267 RepID=A0ABN9HC79_9NEOB|nr:unnamed protein product [Staurois parvus]